MNDTPTHSDFSPNPGMDAAIEAKIEAAILAAGADPKNLTDAELDAIVRSIPWTPEEMEYSGKQHVYKLVQIELGRKMVEVLIEHCRAPRGDIIPCITAYFESIGDEELETA